MAKKIENNREMVEKKSEDAQFPQVEGPFNIMRDFDKIFESFRRDMDRLFLDPWGMPSLMVRRPVHMGTYSPRINVQDKGNEYVVSADMPGMNKDNLDVTIEGNVVIIKAASNIEKKKKDENYLLQERRVYSFQRSFELPEDIKSDGVNGEMKDGVLHLWLPKKESSKKKIHKVNLK